MKRKHGYYFGVCFALVSGSAAPAWAQLHLKKGATQFTLEGYANITAGGVAGLESEWGERGDRVRIDAGLRPLVITPLSGSSKIGVRLAVTGANEDGIDLEEASLLVFGDWGRVELGRRQGLPDVLYGYAPNGYTFTSAEFGLASGRRLDPGGALPLAFLPSSLGRQISGLSSLGFAATLFEDRSAKILYVSPKWKGFEAGLSYSPWAERQGDQFRHLIQTGLVHETYFGEHIFRLGASFTHAEGRKDQAVRYHDLNSVSGGATLILNSEIYLGASATYDSSAAGVVTQAALPASRSQDRVGYALSANYNSGPWTVGGYWHQAWGLRDSLTRNRDDYRAWQIGGSYRFNTKIRLYAADYVYRLSNGVPGVHDRSTAHVLLTGLRFAL